MLIICGTKTSTITVSAGRESSARVEEVERDWLQVLLNASTYIVNTFKLYCF